MLLPGVIELSIVVDIKVDCGMEDGENEITGLKLDGPIEDMSEVIGLPATDCTEDDSNFIELLAELDDPVEGVCEIRVLSGADGMEEESRITKLELDDPMGVVFEVRELSVLVNMDEENMTGDSELELANEELCMDEIVVEPEISEVDGVESKGELEPRGLEEL